MRHKSIALLCLLLGGCAFTKRENRPLWNVFEQHLVPEDPTWFVAALPLTVPGGILSILADTFVAHPIQVSGDAWDDATSLWRNGRPDFEHRYYSEMAFLPLRTVLTPATFLGSFLGRSMFDVEDDEGFAARRSEAKKQFDAKGLEHLARLRADFEQWLRELQQGGIRQYYDDIPELDEELRQQLRAAMDQANALGRLQLYRLASGQPDARTAIPLLDGLRDADPMVRFAVLEMLPRKAEVPAELRAQLQQDAVESIRLTARARWQQP